ncbi:VirB4 family type IV secretion system protein [Planococcus beijingensis]|uniref:VirB4 family type IV secretion system protein n=1 Tax=Planococcus beijingensis TaxID=2782551 RepID=UPI00193BA39C|nr:type IV secretion system protein VirB4 [Planococcus beijingensis]
MLNFLSTLIKPRNDEEVKAERGFNPYLLSKIQPQGGIKFESGYVKTGDGYISCIHVYKYQSLVSDFWLEELMRIEHAVVTLDVATADKKEIIESINKSMAEQNTRYQTAKDNVDRIDARTSYEELDGVYQQITKGEIMKRIHLRAYVKAQTFEELEQRVRQVLDELESLNFRGSVLLNEQDYLWSGIFASYDNQLQFINKRKGKEIQALSVAGGYPFHYTSLTDAHGTYYGTTETNGSVVFDLFHKDKNRKSYNALMVGKMGSGKSTLLKKTVMDQASKGNKVRILDVTGEFRSLVEEMGGKEIALDGSRGIINPLQVFKTVTNEEDGSTNETQSFTQHLSKMSVFYNFINPQANATESTEFEILLRKLYVERKLWSRDPDEIIPITQFQANEYPTFSDLLSLVRAELYHDFEQQIRHENLAQERELRLSNIELSLTNLVDNYGSIFDGTSSIESFDEEGIVSFPLRNLTNLKSEIYQAQIFSILNMLWDSMISEGAPQFNAYNKGKLAFEDASKFLVLIDEGHHLINTREVSQPAVLYLNKFMREARKYFGGLFFASHLISDFVPDGSNNEYAENVKALFDLTQYKFIGQQDAQSLSAIQNVFTGQLTDSETRVIPHLETGKVVLSISGDKNIVFSVDVSKRELAMFGGGA